MMNPNAVCSSILGGGGLAFGLYQVHSLSGVTEGGALGLTVTLSGRIIGLIHRWNASQ